jgi:hypothetical protein
MAVPFSYGDMLSATFPGFLLDINRPMEMQIPAARVGQHRVDRNGFMP